jgi:transcriptional regulator with XRE-family HTH domain
MITREDLIRSSEYWTEIIQNKIYNDFIDFIENNNIPHKQLAQSLGLSKGRISQILSGENLNFRLETIVKLCLTINKIPGFQLLDLDEFIKYDKEPEIRMSFKSITKTLDDVQIYNPSTISEVFILNNKEKTEYENIGTKRIQSGDAGPSGNYSKTA